MCAIADMSAQIVLLLLVINFEEFTMILLNVNVFYNVLHLDVDKASCYHFIINMLVHISYALLLSYAEIQ